MRLWDAVRLDQRRVLTGHITDISSIAFSPDSQTLAAGGWDRSVRLWNVATGNTKLTLVGHIGQIESVAFSPDGTTLTTAGGFDDHTVKFWDTATGRHKTTLLGHRGRIYDITFSPDGYTLASTSRDTKVCLWDVDTGAHKVTLANGASEVSSLAFSPDGHTLAIGDWLGIRLWNVTNRPYQVGEMDTQSIDSIAFSPDGKTIASAGGWAAETVRLWDVATGTPKATLTKRTTGRRSGVSSVAFSPDGRILVSSGGYRDKTVRLWDVTTATPHATLIGHTEGVSSVACSPDGRTLASASCDGTILLWEYPLPQQTAGAPRQSLPRAETSVLQNYPNPFNPETWIPYQLAEPAEVTVRIYTAGGTLIRTLAIGYRAAGSYQQRHSAVYWDGKNESGEPIASGVYFYTLTAGDFFATRKMLIRK